MALYRKNGGVPQELPRSDVLINEDGTATVYSNLANEPDSLLRLGWIRAPDKPPPETGKYVAWLNNAWQQIGLTPERPARPELPKTTVMQRVFDLGFEEQVAALFAANFKLQARWFAPGWPNVYCDDPELLVALTAMGMTAEQKAQVVAL